MIKTRQPTIEEVYKYLNTYKIVNAFSLAEAFFKKYFRKDKDEVVESIHYQGVDEDWVYNDENPDEILTIKTNKKTYNLDEDIYNQVENMDYYVWFELIAELRVLNNYGSLTRTAVKNIKFPVNLVLVEKV